MVTLPAPRLPHLSLDAATATWESAVAATQNELWDGPLLQFLRADEAEIAVTPSSYRFLLAAKAGVPSDTPFQALAVTGVISCHQGFIFGIRSETVAHDQNLIEFAPSGSLETSQVNEEFRRELKEELGIGLESSSQVRLIGLISDVENHVADVVCRVHLNMSFESLERLHRTSGTSEYSSILAVPESSLDDFLGDQEKRLAPNVVGIRTLLRTDLSIKE